MNGNFVRWTAALLLGLLLLGATAAGIAAGPLDTPSDAEREGLSSMRQEEKLARDVYLTLGEAWDLPVFARIARSEQAHLDAVATLLTRYGVTDPVAGLGVGQFADPQLQDWYDQLVAQGRVSPEAALAAGALIEERDIADLTQHLATTGLADVRVVYAQLLAASQQHLRAFVANLRWRGVTYQPQVLSAKDYAAVLASGGTTTPRGRWAR